MGTYESEGLYACVRERARGGEGEAEMGLPGPPVPLGATPPASDGTGPLAAPAGASGALSGRRGPGPPVGGAGEENRTGLSRRRRFKLPSGREELRPGGRSGVWTPHFRASRAIPRQVF